MHESAFASAARRLTPLPVTTDCQWRRRAHPPRGRTSPRDRCRELSAGTLIWNKP